METLLILCKHTRLACFSTKWAAGNHAQVIIVSPIDCIDDKFSIGKSDLYGGRVFLSEKTDLKRQGTK